MTEIEIFADIWCPFTHVGLRAVMRQRAALGRDDVAVRVRAWPLELVNGEPMDTGRTAEHIRELRHQVAPDLFDGFDPETFPRTTLPALALAAAAYRRDTRTGEAVSLALRDALFEQGLDVSRPEVLEGIAQEHGLDPPVAADAETVLAEWHDGEARGVKGSPHFFCGDLDSFCPSLDIWRDPSGEMHIEADTAALDEVLTRCFGT